MFKAPTVNFVLHKFSWSEILNNLIYLAESLIKNGFRTPLMC